MWCSSRWLCDTTSHSKNENRVLLQLNALFINLYADNLGFSCNGYKIFSKIVTKGINIYHKCRRKDGPTAHTFVMKWLLKMIMNFSATLVQCTCGDASINLKLFVLLV